MHRFMRRWAESDGQQEVYDFIEANVKSGTIKRHHLRWYDVLLEEKTSGDNHDWRKWAINQWLQLALPAGGKPEGRRRENDRTKLQFVARMRNENLDRFEAYRRYEAECAALRLTGGLSTGLPSHA